MAIHIRKTDSFVHDPLLVPSIPEQEDEEPLITLVHTQKQRKTINFLKMVLEKWKMNTF